MTGASTLTGAVTHSASTTLAGDVWFSESATSTVGFATAGLNFDSSTFVIDPNSNRVGILTAAPNTAFEVVGTASTTNLVVGSETTLAALVSGTCSFVQRTIAASSTGHVDCTSATGVRAGDRIFLTATSGLEQNFMIQAASSSATESINIRLFNTGLGVNDTTAGPATLFFWATR